MKFNKNVTDQEIIERMKEKNVPQEIIDNLMSGVKDYRKRKEEGNLTEMEKRAVEINNELFRYMKEVFPNIENENAPFICSNKFYSCIDNTILLMRWFHTSPKLFKTKLYGENGWKYSDEWVELFKKIIDFYRTEIYDKIPE